MLEESDPAIGRSRDQEDILDFRGGVRALFYSGLSGLKETLNDIPDLYEILQADALIQIAEGIDQLNTFLRSRMQPTSLSSLLDLVAPPKDWSKTVRRQWVCKNCGAVGEITAFPDNRMSLVTLMASDDHNIKFPVCAGPAIMVRTDCSDATWQRIVRGVEQKTEEAQQGDGGRICTT